MPVQSQTLSEWVTELNDTLFIQPNDEIALKAVHEQVDPSLVVKINHNVYTYDEFRSGLQHARSYGTSTQDTFSVILQWENPEKPDGVVAVLSKSTVKEKATGKETKKTNVILWEVKWIDGKRKLTGQTEVEAL
ncbi:01af48e8-0ef2-4a93-9721-0e4c16af4077 [Sclerotinia trifoliorum]|uniref:01af48e8-0ef2-4a93-9721-0e4c16af4077 n=1 Tax=Sclerotinia trifoliorum TaxID=28548 RepID=A0A8H2VVC6_9HELO|nr:01af48e8-0ef2-4a93-9721-0e4c16af4077 [Sclerotinia trifoliorum]